MKSNPENMYSILGFLLLRRHYHPSKCVDRERERREPNAASPTFSFPDIQLSTYQIKEKGLHLVRKLACGRNITWSGNWYVD